MNSPPLEPTTWLSQAKLQPPGLRHDLIDRPTLVETLREMMATRALTLISAPAGYGKTTLLAQAAAGMGGVAWLSLDVEENDPARFLTAVILALQKTAPGLGKTAQSLISHGSIPGHPPSDPTGMARRVLGALANEISAAALVPLTLALDDLHLIKEPVLYVALSHLLEHMPPTFHVLISTRHDPPLPLARLRAAGKLGELRLAELRLTAEEQAHLCNDRLRLDLSAGDLASLGASTEGWAAGLALLAVSLERIHSPGERSAFIGELARKDRYVFEYLAEQVLQRKEPEMKTFLLETSVLPELTPALCEAVTGRADARAMLEEMYRRNLFLISVDAAGTTFRYHALFAEFLRSRLDQEWPGRSAELHLRAARAESIPAHAVPHFLAAREWEAAAQIIDRIGSEFIHRGWLASLQGWIEAIPAEIRCAHPRLDLFMGSCRMHAGDTRAAQPLLERALGSLRASFDMGSFGQAMGTLISCVFMQADYARTEELVREAMGYPVPPPARTALLMTQALLGIIHREWERARADVSEALQIAESTRSPDVFRVAAFLFKPDFIALPGVLAKVEEFCAAGAQAAGEPTSPVGLAIMELTSMLYLWRGRVDEAIRAGGDALAIKQQLGGYPFLGMEAACTVGMAYAARGEYAAAESWLNQAGEMIFQPQGQLDVVKLQSVCFLYRIARTLWQQGRTAEAREFYARMCAAQDPRESPSAPILRMTLQGLLEISEARPGAHGGRHYATAERTLQEAARLERQTPVVTVYGSARAMLAHLYFEWNRPDQALAELEPLLERCERDRTPGLVLKEGAVMIPLLRLAAERGVSSSTAARMLAMMGSPLEPTPLRVPGTGENLTLREIEVLRLIALGKGNRAIAQELVIGEQTVKTHVAHLLRKLNASSRTQAVAHARDLRILS